MGETQKTELPPAMSSGLTEGLGSAAWGWLPAALALAALQACGFAAGHGDFWKTAWATCAACESLRLAAVAGLPAWWRRRHAGVPLKRSVQEVFAVHALSFMVALYTLSHLAMARPYLSREIPFLHTRGDGPSVAVLHQMTAMLLTYVVVDTSHMLRTWRLNPNPAMLVHHVVFSVVLVLGALFPQLPDQYRIHAVLFSAELSTPLLNLRWILRWVVGRPGGLALNLAFVALFLLSRIGLYGALLVDLWQVRTQLQFPPLLQDTFCAAVALSYLLNLYWAGIIVSTARAQKRRPPAAGAAAAASSRTNGGAKLD